jgi:hypothetical protein
MTIDSSSISDANSLSEAFFRTAEQYAENPAEWYRKQG